MLYTSYNLDMEIIMMVFNLQIILNPTNGIIEMYQIFCVENNDQFEMLINY